MFGMPDNRTGFSMRVHGVHLTLPELHLVAAELGINNRDVLYKDHIITIYNTSQECQEIIDDGTLAAFVAMALNISPDDISDITAVQANAEA
jgi:hypothetical protein